MRSHILVTLSLLTITFGLSAVSAHTPDSNSNCNIVGDETAKIDLGVAEVRGAVEVPDVATIYVADPEKSIGIWLESNGLDGLQTHEHTCRLSPQSDPMVVGADTQLL